MTTSASSTRLHRSKSGEWVPCHASVRPCPREHIEISPSGTMVEKSELMTDVVASVKKRNKSKSIEEQLAAVRAARSELYGKEKPYADAGKDLWQEEKRLVTKYWKAAEARDYLELDDYDGMQSLMDDAFYDSAASDYQRRYIKSLDPFLEPNGYQPNWMLPAIRVHAPYGLSDEQINHTAGALSKWASFVTRHRGDESNTNGSHQNYLDAYGKERVEEEEKEAAYENIQLLSDSSGEDGIPAIRVYGDGTATAVMTVYSNHRRINDDGTVSYEMHPNFYKSRRPLAEVLRVVNKHWYYPASSKPGYEERDYENDDYYSDGDY